MLHDSLASIQLIELIEHGNKRGDIKYIIYYASWYLHNVNANYVQLFRGIHI